MTGSAAYQEQREVLERQVQRWEATLHGFVSSQYAPAPPAHWYGDDTELRACFEQGHAMGKAILNKPEHSHENEARNPLSV